MEGNLKEHLSQVTDSLFFIKHFYWDILHVLQFTNVKYIVQWVLVYYIIDFYKLW